MILIEPCCTQKHILELRHKLGEDGTVMWHGYGDLSAAELLTVLMNRYVETDLVIVAPSLPDLMARTLKYWMGKTISDGGRRTNVIETLTVIANLNEKKSPLASSWRDENPFPGRLILRDKQQNDTAIILPDIAFYGPINMTYGHHFTALATKNRKTIETLKDTYLKL